MVDPPRENVPSRRGSRDSQLNLVNWSQMEKQFILFGIHCKKIAQYSTLARIIANFICVIIFWVMALRGNIVLHWSDLLIIFAIFLNFVLDCPVFMHFYLYGRRISLLLEVMVFQWAMWLLASYCCFIFSCLWFLCPHLIKFESQSILRDIVNLLTDENVLYGYSARLYILICIGITLIMTAFCAYCYYGTILFKYYTEEISSDKPDEENNSDTITLQALGQAPLFGL